VSAVIAYLLRGLGHVRARRRSRPLPSDDVRRSGGGHTPIPGHLRRREFLNQPVCLVQRPTGRLRGIAACSRVHVIPVRCCTPPASPNHFWLANAHDNRSRPMPMLINGGLNRWLFTCNPPGNSDQGQHGISVGKGRAIMLYQRLRHMPLSAPPPPGLYQRLRH
jgi:hypothetical protein